MAALDIRLATTTEAVEVLQEPRLITALTEEARANLLRYVTDANPPHYIVKYGKYQLIFRFWSIGKGIYSFHIACPNKSIVASRLLATLAMNYIFTNIKDCGILTTACPAGKIANFCRKLGATELKQYAGNIYFAITKLDYFSSLNKTES